MQSRAELNIRPSKGLDAGSVSALMAIQRSFTPNAMPDPVSVRSGLN